MTLIFWLILAGLILLIPTAYAAFIGAPYAPTRLPVVRKAFGLVGLNNKDVLVDLGAGDGKILFEAARCGAKAYGYELSPIMFSIAWLRALMHQNVKVLYGNFYKKKFPDATMVFAFLMPENMHKIKSLITRDHLPNAKYLLAYAFPIKDVAPHSVVRENKCAPLYVYDIAELTKKE